MHEHGVSIRSDGNWRVEEDNTVSSTIDAPLEWVESVGDLRLPPKQTGDYRN